MNFKEEVAKQLKIDGLTREEIINLLESPKNDKMGDIAFPCFLLAKQLKKSPNVIAVEIAGSIQPNKVISKCEPLGGYVNFFLSRKFVLKTTLAEIKNEGKNYYKSTIFKGKVLAFDFSSVNLAKYFHVGHMRNTVTGMVLANIFESVGYDVKRLNYLGDYGLPFGLMVAGYKIFAKPKTFDMDWLQALYVKTKELEKSDTEFAAYGRKCFKDIEEGDKETLEIYNIFREITLKETKPIFDTFNLSFDNFNGELYYSKFIKDAVKILEDKNLLKDSEGRKIVELGDYGMPDAVIFREDGASVYTTRDIATVVERAREFNFDKMIYLVGMEQTLHFKQLFKIVSLMGITSEDKLQHLANGLYRLETGKISSRDGKVLLLKDLIDEAINQAKDVLTERYKNDSSIDINSIASDIGIGALIFSVVSNTVPKDVVFSLEKALSFDGETGPYLQYTHARMNSVIKKGIDAGIEPVFNNFDLTDEQYAIVKMVAGFKDMLIESAAKLEPNILARYLIDLAALFNKFYNENKIIGDNIEVSCSRLAFTKMVKETLAAGLELLNIKPLEKM